MADEDPKEVTAADLSDPTFEVREGDRLVVHYAGAKVSIAGTYSSVELDGATYSRTMLEGDDAGEQFDRIYGYLKKKTEAVARAKLTWFADQCRRAEARAKGQSEA